MHESVLFQNFVLACSADCLDENYTHTIFKLIVIQQLTNL